AGHAAPRARARRARRDPDRAADDPVLPARRLVLHRRGPAAGVAGADLDAGRRALRDAGRAVLMVLDIIGAVLLALGLTLATIGLYGLLRMPDIFHQLHPAGLVSGPAVILVVLASAATGSAEIITSAALVILFVLITSPLSTHAIAQAARHRP